MSDLTAVTDQDFENAVLKSSKPVLIDFWAEWCGPCRALGPILDEVANEYGDKVTFMKLTVDENPETPAHFGIRGIPTLILFKNGQAHATQVGALTKSQLIQFLDNATK